MLIELLQHEVFQLFVFMMVLLLLILALAIKILSSPPFYEPTFADVIELNNKADKELGIDIWLLQRQSERDFSCVLTGLGDGEIIHRTHGLEHAVRADLTQQQAKLANSCPPWAENIAKTTNDPSIGIN